MARNDIDKAGACEVLGGTWNGAGNKCTLPGDRAEVDAASTSITRDEHYAWFFILQVIVGTTTAIAGTYYNYTFAPPYWWSNFAILGIMVVVVLVMTWFKIANWTESIIRVAVTTLVIVGVSIGIGIIYYWDASVVIDINWIFNWPIISAIFGVPLSAFLSIVLLDMPRREKSMPIGILQQRRS